MQKIVLLSLCLACAGHVQRTQDDLKSLATLLLSSNMAVGFAPSAAGASAPKSFDRRSPATDMKNRNFQNQALAAAMAVAIAAAPHAANAVPANMNYVTANPSDDEIAKESSLPSETIEDTIARRANADKLLLLPGLSIVGAIGLLYAQFDEAQPDEEDFFDAYESRRVEATLDSGLDVGGGKWSDARNQDLKGGREFKGQGSEFKGAGSVRAILGRIDKSGAAAAKAAADAAKRSRR